MAPNPVNAARNSTNPDEARVKTISGDDLVKLTERTARVCSAIKETTTNNIFRVIPRYVVEYIIPYIFALETNPLGPLVSITSPLFCSSLMLNNCPVSLLATCQEFTVAC